MKKDISRANKPLRISPYQEYKDSGVDWLGEIPSHWELKRLKYLAPISDERYFEQNRYQIYIGLEHIESGTGKLLANPITEQVESIASIFKPGDVLFGKLRPYLAKVFLPEFEGICSTELLVLRSHGIIHPKVLFYQLLCEDLIRWISSTTFGTKMPRADPAQISNIYIAFGSNADQRSIFNFLDRETAKIDALMEKKEKLIELLKEKRAALITQAVTKGLDPSVPMKDSSVEWFGEIPAHWEKKRLKFLLLAPLKYGANEAAELDDPELPRYVRITDIDERDALRNETFKSLPAEIAKEYLLSEGDLLFARSGATVGKTFLYRRSWGKCAYAGYLIRARLDSNKIYPDFIRYFTASLNYWQWLTAAFIQATIQNMSAERYASLILPVPPIAEQLAIVDFLDREIMKVDALAENIQKGIDLLKEYRSALISAAVTGKIDVRGETTSCKINNSGSLTSRMGR